MVVYFSLFVVIILINMLPNQNKHIANAKLIFSFFIIFIYASIRIDYGRDYFSYFNMFHFINEVYDGINNLNFVNGTEIGYVLLNKLLPTHRSLLVLLSAFTCYTYYWFFRNFVPSKYFWYAFFLMAFLGNMLLFFQLSGLRNAIAINIFTLSIPFLINRKLLPFILLTILAFFFHRSAILFMPVAYFVATPREFKNNDVVKWSITGIILIIMSSTKLVGIIEPFITTYFNKYQGYLEHASEYKMSIQSTILMISFIFVFFTLSFFILRSGKLNKDEIIIFKLSLIFVISFALGPLNIRTSQYFALFFLLTAIITLIKIKVPIIKFSYLGFMLFYLIYSFIFDFIMGDPNFSYGTYHTIFD